MEKTTLLVLLPALVAVVACLGLVRGVVTKRPPGQRGLVGTELEHSRGLSDDVAGGVGGRLPRRDRRCHDLAGC
jgi:hypothetical protein